jgi:hypothetical protein
MFNTSFFDRNRLRAANLVQCQIAGNDRHPGDRRAGPRVEGRRAPPDSQIGFLHDLVGQILPAKDTEDDPIEFRRGRAEKRAKGVGVLGRHPPQQFGEIVRRCRWSCHRRFLPAAFRSPLHRSKRRLQPEFGKIDA